MSKDIRIKKGVNINLKGSAERVYASIPQAECFVVKPSDFKGLTPKLSVKAGDKVQAGSSLFYDKENPSIKITSPVSGEVTEIRRGEKRKILEVVIKADAEISYIEFPKADAKTYHEIKSSHKCWMLVCGLLFVNDLMLLLQIQMTCQKRYSYQHLIVPL